jgi:hypothetical protein
MDARLKTDSAKLDALETLRATPAVLLGVDAPAADALKLAGIESVFDRRQDADTGIDLTYVDEIEYLILPCV